MTSTAHRPGPLTLIGCGASFEAIAAEPAAYGLAVAPELRRIASVAAIAAAAETVFDGLPGGEGAPPQVFIAVEANALNYARLELYGRARLRGVPMATLVHARAVVAASAQLADNCLVSPAALIGPGATLAGDVFIGAGARLDAQVAVAAHGWVGAGAVLGAGCRIGTHSVVGADVRLRAGVSLGRHCVVDRAGEHGESLRDGTFIEPVFSGAAQVVGAGYSFQSRG